MWFRFKLWKMKVGEISVYACFFILLFRSISVALTSLESKCQTAMLLYTQCSGALQIRSGFTFLKICFEKKREENKKNIAYTLHSVYYKNGRLS